MLDPGSAIYREADWAQQMLDSPGWSELARWVTERVTQELDALEQGVRDWDDYQRSVGRLEAFRGVLARPEDVVELARARQRGDDE